MTDDPTDMKNKPVSSDDVCKALASLASRVGILEQTSQTSGGSGDGSDLRQVVAATAKDLRALRVMLIRSGAELEGRLKETDAVKLENIKLKYQIVHLKRSLEAEEK